MAKKKKQILSCKSISSKIKLVMKVCMQKMEQ